MVNEKGSQGQGSSSGTGSNRQTNDDQNNQAVQVFGNDMYTVGFVLLLLLMGLMKAAQMRCTC
eukprot:CAMPEP_0196570270 /NCGR_PEP_ID=MMETSP1081-20130531/196_1 /TAXON_ID=36882 /ORGANISM="Pyramimonas amylifera, Strain CCMP720" /LENGTH=62 /DNA_ID=CAMNT_0041886589 /DNA_START=264 /DNA_END=452 /DNA_ORIENTATION=+